MNLSDLSTGKSMMKEFVRAGWEVVCTPSFEGVSNSNVIGISLSMLPSDTLP